MSDVLNPVQVEERIRELANNISRGVSIVSNAEAASRACSVEHAERVRGFREHVAIWEAEAERETGGYVGDMRAYLENNPRPQFRDWLIHTRRER